MPKLSDLVNVDINRDTIKIQGVPIPVIFTFRSFPYVEEAYGKSYEEFEKDMNDMLKDGRVTLGNNETKLMNALIYAMVKSGGTDCSPQEIESSIPVSDLGGVFQVALNIFNRQNFQISDMERIKSEKKSETY
ncbi:hypothetical protein [Metabacillus halosaccharovorans]|uniref:Phage protein n=1 Tax=Metabacillus halosaccharovorans TaxID=930124 RepID=A0ABT3DCB8_9BACI|nr:hypothetical protein [Metabacillus halosaccharovorans]MCV9884699.1 hypothetical protein [Metabacillus halosaccharovorans]